jgi:hypothetical protein
MPSQLPDAHTGEAQAPFVSVQNIEWLMPILYWRVLPCSVARRPSAGAQISGRGGAGNVFKGEDTAALRAASKENAIEDGTLPPSTASTNSGSSNETQAAKSKPKSWFFGKKN